MKRRVTAPGFFVVALIFISSMILPTSPPVRAATDAAADLAASFETPPMSCWPKGRFTFAPCDNFSKDSPLLPSGLFGPVTLQTTTEVVVK